MYSWQGVARRTEVVYDAVAAKKDGGIVASLARQLQCGPVFGVLACCVVLAQWMYGHLLAWLLPAADVEVAPDLSRHFSLSLHSEPRDK